MTRDGSLLSEEDDKLPLTWREFRHLLQAPLRRPLMAGLPWVAVVLLSVVALFVLPKKYESSTLILVESEKMPESFVAKVATDDRTQRLWVIRPEILSRTRLERVLDETQPFPRITSTARAVEAMRKAISFDVSGNEGFTLAFVHSDPRKAQQVTSRIATLFIEETINAREKQVDGAVDFLNTQVAESRKALEKNDEALRRFKEARMGRLPSQLQTNLATMAMLQREIRAVDETLFFAQEKQDALSRRTGETVGGRSGVSATTDMDELARLRSQLAALRARRYTDEHPDVQSVRLRMARLEARRPDTPAGAGQTGEGPSAVVREQLERNSLEIRNLEEKRRSLERQIATVRANIGDTPRTEQELATLTRDYDKLNENYVALLQKQLEAQMAGRLEQRWKKERFRILDPASLPEKPVFPKPTVVVGLGLVLGLFAGLGVSVAAEFLDPTVKDTEDLEIVQGFPVLGCIPHHPRLHNSST